MRSRVVAQASERHADRGAGADVGGVRERALAGCGQGGGNAVLSSCSGVVAGSWQSGRGPDQPTRWIGDYLHVHPMSLVLARVTCPSNLPE